MEAIISSKEENQVLILEELRRISNFRFHAQKVLNFALTGWYHQENI